MIDETTHTQQQHRMKTVHVYRESNGCREEIQYTQVESNVSFNGVVCPSNQLKIGEKNPQQKQELQLKKLDIGQWVTSSGYNVE